MRRSGCCFLRIGPARLCARLCGLGSTARNSGVRRPISRIPCNALAASACCLSLGLSLEQLRAGLESFAAAFGRAEQIEVAGRPVSILVFACVLTVLIGLICVAGLVG